jgi:small subunit ribosomal protein S14
MAKICVKQRELKRDRLVARKANKRAELKESARQAYKRGDIPWTELAKLGSMSPNASAVRQRNRCRLCGRPHGVYKKFGLCRLHLRIFAMKGYVPGLRKASW